MKLVVEQSSDCPETEIHIRCGFIDERLQHLIAQIRLHSFSVMAEKDGASVPIAPERIFYFDSVDNKTYLYVEKEVYRCAKKLYELEQVLAGTPFVRVSKNCILNTAMVASVRAQLSGRLEATLQNGEKILISKHYIKEFRNRFA
ncbi:MULTISPECIES: LytTR family DNA-binding domain-containing protein [Caproicibacterium]|uniref:LytTR family DNA-binding domain-containing protein n=1 Tax=Caproicibacterium argilliputei TaxID=3030016 RepID=A0AA97H190_9FIRM|nr:LytTR family DNA-binding domain-containing protein [Caproicibacterium argilliputei]WOC31395.1 LytTR family DNA-binding domain-containing protein [Caproicibacterium argilliputei]